MASVCSALTFLFHPDMKLFDEVGHHQESLPALPFLGLEDVCEDVVSHVQDLFAPHVQQVTHNVRGA